MKYFVTINNKRYEVEVERGEANILSTSEVVVGVAEPAVGIKPSTPIATQQPSVQPSGSGQPLKCPMPGTVLDIKVTQGARVKKGDILFILEAMKMENEITAEKDGVVVQILVAKGASVNTNDVLAVIQ